MNLVQFGDKNLTNIKSSLEEKYNLIQIPYPLFLKAFLYIIKASFRILKKIGMNRAGTFGDGLTYLINSCYYIIYTRLRMSKYENQVFITGDPPGNIAANLLSKKNNNKFIFWSLELFLEDELQDWGMRFIKSFERKTSRNINCVVEFGEMRAKLIIEENGISKDIPIFIIPNSRLGKSEVKRNYYFNELFDIPRDKKIILYGGGIYGDTNNTNALLEAAYSWPEDYVLILHAKKRRDLANQIKIDEERSAGKIYFDDSPVNFDEIDKIYSSSDVGLVINSPNGQWFYSNHFYGQLSLGKLFHYTYNGVPVITKKLFGYEELIEDQGIGYCIDEMTEIKTAVDKILAKKDTFGINCMNFSDKFSFEKHHRPLIDFVGKLAC